jgi:hypothetical protein
VSNAKKITKKPEPELSQADYQVDMPTLLTALGIHPGTVKPDTTHLSFQQGMPILEYGVIRAVPSRALGLAILAAAEHREGDEEGDSGG